MKNKIKILPVIVMCAATAGCAAVILGGGAAAAGGYTVAKNKGPVGQYTSDSVITSKIKSKFLTEKNFKSANISVATNQGVVILTGTVPTEEMRSVAIDIARNTADVKAVNVTNFKVNP